MELGADVFFYFVEVFVGECVHNQILESFLLSKSCLFDSIVLLFYYYDARDYGYNLIIISV